MKTKFHAAAALAAFFVLGACSNEPIDVGPADPQANALKNMPKELPPSIKSARTYRCRDNSLVHISFLDDNVTALVRDKEENPPIATLKAPAPGQPFVFEGFSLTGSGETVTYKSPQSGTQTCRSSTCVASVHLWPNGSSIVPLRSP
jgi:hypothetical protein